MTVYTRGRVILVRRVLAQKLAFAIAVHGFSTTAMILGVSASLVPLSILALRSWRNKAPQHKAFDQVAVLPLLKRKQLGDSDRHN